MPQDPERIQVEFLGEAFTVITDSSEEDILNTSAFLREQMDFLQKRHPSLSPKKLAILTAFYLADKFLRTSRDYEALISILDG
jgi:cell division protein ZapA (FtsZ GTPase activity inhibitor)